MIAEAASKPGAGSQLTGRLVSSRHEAPERREAIRDLAGSRRKLAAAEDALADALAAMNSAEAVYDAANDRFTEAERALHAAREQRARAREARYAARQAHERAATTAARLQRRVSALAERLNTMGDQEHLPLAESSTGWTRMSCQHSAPPTAPAAGGARLLTSAPQAPYSRHERTLIRPGLVSAITGQVF